MRSRWLLLGVMGWGCQSAPALLTLTAGAGERAASAGIIELRGIPRQAVQRLGALPPGDRRWARLLSVRAGRETSLPPMAGLYLVDDRSVSFTPRFPPEGIPELIVALDTALWHSVTGTPLRPDQVTEWQVALPVPEAPAASTSVLGIYPSAPIVPANQLRWYLEFSAPMREGEAERHLTLVDEAGQAVSGALLVTEQELWDSSRTRLTILFDMGRVKHGIRTRLEQGPVLHAGKRYAWRIDEAWRDARGAALVAGTVHTFLAGPEDRAPIDPAGWQLSRVRSESRDPLTIEFGKPLDHAMAPRLVAVTTRQGNSVGGQVQLAEHDRRWSFVPDLPWSEGTFEVRVHPALEDLAGNRPGHAFDADMRAGEGAGNLGEALKLAFEVGEKQ